MGKFIPNPLALPEIARTLEVLEACEVAAEKAAEAAKEIAPVATGAYKKSIGSDAGVEGTAVGRVYAKDYKADWIEFGTSERSPEAVLRRGAEHVGLKVVGGKDE